MKHLLLILTLIFSLSASSQVQQETKQSSFFQVFYMGYSDYMVGGYYGQLTNFTDQDMAVTITYADGIVIVDVPAMCTVAFTLPATRYTINSKITAISSAGGSTLTVRVRGSYY
jgi:hypothetical protein